MRVTVDKTNSLIHQYCDDEYIHWLDINDLLLTEDGLLEANVMPDYLHPNAQQYMIWGQAICDTVKTIKARLR
jgi:beta-glucosidase